MKNFPNTQSKIETSNVISDVSNILHAEWNINRYIGNPTITVDHTLSNAASTENVYLEADQIIKKFPIDSIATPNRSLKSSYVIEGTKYRTTPVYVNQRGRNDYSWQTDTTWLWYGNDTKFKYWTSALKANGSGSLPYNTGRIVYTWGQPKPVNKIAIRFQQDNAFPVSWNIYIDTTGEQQWSLISSNANVPASGEFVLYRDTYGQPQLPGDWNADTLRWTPELNNHINCYGIKVVISSVDIPHGRPAIIELSPRLEADLTSFFEKWSVTEELSDQDFISPLGSASANVGDVTLSNTTGLFNEHDEDGIFYAMMDEEVRFKGYVKIGQDTIPMFNMLSDSWNTTDFDTCSVNLVDDARILQNTNCKDMIVSDVTAGAALHILFAALGIPQFNIIETTIKQTPNIERFFTKKESKVWEVVQELCKGLQISMYFDSTGQLKMRTKEATFNTDAALDYEFSSERRTDRVPDIFSLERSENSRFNKVRVRYYAVNDFSLSGSRNQKMWTSPDPWVIGAAQIVKNINQGDNHFWIDPNRPEDLPNFSGTVLIENRAKEIKYEGKQYYCKYAAVGNQYIRVNKPSDYWAAVERNNGKAPRFTGKVFLKDSGTFHKDFKSKNYNFVTNWDIIEYSMGSPDGRRMSTGAKHSPVDGCLQVETTYTGSKRLSIFKKSKSWNRFDRVGIKFKVSSNEGRVGVVLWPQGRNGASGYHFIVDPMNEREARRFVEASNDEDNSTRVASGVHGFVVKPNGDRADLEFDTAKDFSDIPPLRIGKWSYLEVAVYVIPNGYEFEVFVNGQYCKTYKDTTVKLTRNEKAGMTFMGYAADKKKTLVDNFYVVNYPKDSIRSKDSDDAAFIVRRADLWRDRKASSGDKQFSKYLRMMEQQKKTQVFEEDFSGRFFGVAREKVNETVRFEQPALTAEIKSSNSSVDVVRFEAHSFGARFSLINRSERPQLLQGTRKTKVNGADRRESTYIFGTSFRVAEVQEIEHKTNALMDRLGELLIEFESNWIQNRETATDIAEWVVDRFGDNAEVYTLEVFGNPLVEVGDIVSIEWPEKGLSDSVKWCVVKVTHNWENGISTSVTVRRII